MDVHPARSHCSETVDSEIWWTVKLGRRLGNVGARKTGARGRMITHALLFVMLRVDLPKGRSKRGYRLLGGGRDPDGALPVGGASGDADIRGEAWPIRMDRSSCRRHTLAAARLHRGERSRLRGRILVPLLLSQLFIFVLLSAWSAPASAETAICAGSVVRLETLNSRPFAQMRLGSHQGYFLIDTGASFSQVDGRLFDVVVGNTVKLEGLSLPTFTWGTFRARDFTGFDRFTPGGHQAGIIGTDCLSLRTVELHYETEQPYMALSRLGCAAKRMTAAGFIAVDQRGYYSHDTSHLTVVRGSNSPVIFLRIGGVSFPAWIDTGWGSQTGLVAINEKVLDALRHAGVPMHSLSTMNTVRCDGPHDYEVWQVDGAPLEFSDRGGRRLFKYDLPILVVYTPDTCGGPAKAGIPFGLIPALFLSWWGPLIIDGPNERVWVPSRPERPPPPVFNAMALAWNDRGAWAVRTALAEDEASTAALSACNELYGNCSIRGKVSPAGVGCLAVARSKNGGRLSMSVNPSLTEVRSGVLENCAASLGGTCTVEYAACNVG